MFKMSHRAGVPALAAGALALGLAAPAGAAAAPSLATINHDVKAASAALVKFEKLAHKHSASARKQLKVVVSDVATAAHHARWLHSSASTSTAAQAFTLVAGQYSADLQVFTSLLGTATGSLQTAIAGALQPALAGQTQAMGFLSSLTGSLSATGAGTATAAIGGLVTSGSDELQSLTGLLSGGNLPVDVQTLVGQAITNIGGVLDATIAQLESLVPSLPAAAQPQAAQMLEQLKTVFDQIAASLTQAVQAVQGGTTSASLPGLGAISSLLTGLLSGAGVTGSTTTGTSLPVQLPSFITGLLGQLGATLPVAV